jgi:hypothetical protein
MSEAATDFAPCRLLEHDDGRFSLLFFNFEVSDQFERSGRLGNGYAWQSALEYLVQQSAPQLVGKISYDSEADMFVAISPDYAALKQLVALIRRAIDNPAILAEAISNSEWD